MAFNGMPQIPSVSQGRLAITATQFSSFVTPAITVPFPSVYAGQTQIPLTFAATPTYAAGRVPSTFGGQAATAGVHSINAAASAAGYRTHDYGNNGGGSGWPTWATAVIAAAGGIAVVLVVAGLFCWRYRRRQKARRRATVLAASQGGQGFRESKRFTRSGPPAGAGAGALAAGGAAAGLGEKGRRSKRPAPVAVLNKNEPPSAYGSTYTDYGKPPGEPGRPYDPRGPPLTPTRPDGFTHPQQQAHFPPYGGAAAGWGGHRRVDSAGSDSGLLPPAAGFAYMENSPDQAGWVTPPRRAPNDYGDSPQSPAHLLTNDGGGASGGGSQYYDTPRSSMTVSTRGTGGAPYRWDQDADLADHMPNPEEASAALGRAMMLGQSEEYVPLSAGSRPVSPERHNFPSSLQTGPGPAGRYSNVPLGAPAAVAAYGRHDQPSYPPPASRSGANASRSSSRPRSAPRDSHPAGGTDRGYDNRRAVTPSPSPVRRSMEHPPPSRPRSAQQTYPRPLSYQPQSHTGGGTNRLSLAPPIGFSDSPARRSLESQRRPQSRSSNHRRSAYEPDDASAYSHETSASAAAPSVIQQAANRVSGRPSRNYR